MSDLFYATIWKDQWEDAKYAIGSFVLNDGLRFGTQLHGGYSTASFPLTTSGKVSADMYRLALGGHLVIFDRLGTRVFEGQINRTSASSRGLTATALGYFARAKKVLINDGVWTATNLTIYDVIKDCLEAMDPVWSPFPGLLAGANFVVGKIGKGEEIKVSDAITNVLKFGYKTTDLRGLFFALYEHRIARLIPEPVFDQVPDWHVELFTSASSDTTMELTIDDVYNKLYVLYDDAADDTTGPTLYPTPEEDWLSQNIYGTLEGIINAGQYTQAVARDLLEAALERFAFPRQSFSATITTYVRNAAGNLEPPYRIRAGDTIMVTDADPVTLDAHMFSSRSAGGLLGFVMSTEYDAQNQSLSITVGTGDNRFDYIMSRLGLRGGVG